MVVMYTDCSWTIEKRKKRSVVDLMKVAEGGLYIYTMNTRRSGWADMAIGVQFNNVFFCIAGFTHSAEKTGGIGKVDSPLFSKIQDILYIDLMFSLTNYPPSKVVVIVRWVQLKNNLRTCSTQSRLTTTSGLPIMMQGYFASPYYYRFAALKAQRLKGVHRNVFLSFDRCLTNNNIIYLFNSGHER